MAHVLRDRDRRPGWVEVEAPSSGGVRARLLDRGAHGTQGVTRSSTVMRSSSLHGTDDA
jgi:hypothetical protein